MASIRGLALNSTGIAITDGSYQVNRNLISEDAANIPGEPTIYGGIYNVNGSFSAAYRPQTLNTFIELGILGKSGGGVADTFTHYDITLGNEFNKAWTFASCALTSCDISMQAGQYSKCNFEWIGTYKKLSDTTIPAADYTHEPTMFYNAYLDNMKCRGITFRIDRPLAADDTILGSEYSQTLVQTDNLTIGGTITLSNADYEMMDNVLYTSDEGAWNNDEAKNNTTLIGDLTIKFRNPSGTVDLCQIYLDEIHVQDLNVSVTGMQRFEKTVEWRAITTSSSGITFSVP
jgi:hypothetical protein